MTTQEHPARLAAQRSMDAVTRGAKQEWLALFAPDAVIEDPKVLTGPWKVPTQTLKLAPFDQIMEIACSGVETAPLMEAASKQNYGKK